MAFVFFDTGYYLRPQRQKTNIPESEDFLYGFGLGLNLETGLGRFKSKLCSRSGRYI